MRLIALQMRNFRNFERVELACGPRLNIFVGNNGQGKTNILESIYVLAQVRSFRGVGRAELTRWGTDVVSMKGLVEHPTHGEGLTLETAWDRQRRLLKVKGHESRRVVDYLGHLSALVFFADSPQIIKGPPQERRRLVDRALVSLQPTYLSLLLRYQMVLKQRNRLLKGPKPDRPSLDVWNAKFVELGAILVRARARYILRINQRVARLGELKLGDPGALRVLYQPALGQPGDVPAGAGEGDAWANGADLAHCLREGIAKVERDELRFRGSLVGPQRDEISFRLHGRDLRSYGSQGEQRLAVFLVLIAMLEDAEAELGTPPLVLLDDMAAELDRQRRDLLWEFLQSIHAQVFLTGTELTPELDRLRTEVPDTHVWSVCGGAISRMP